MEARIVLGSPGTLGAVRKAGPAAKVNQLRCWHLLTTAHLHLLLTCLAATGHYFITDYFITDYFITDYFITDYFITAHLLLTCLAAKRHKGGVFSGEGLLLLHCAPEERKERARKAIAKRWAGHER